MIKEISYSEFIEEKPCVRLLIDEHGREVLDTTPVSIRIPAPPPPSSMMELMHRLYKEMANAEVETFADAEDFDVPDELGIEMRNTPYELDFDHITENSATSSGTDDLPPQSEKVTENSA